MRKPSTLSMIIVFILFIFTSESLTAQKEKCAFDHQLKELKKDPVFLQNRQNFEDFAMAFKRNSDQLRNAGTTIIPCVVHIIHTGQAIGTASATGANPNNAQIISAITDMNNAFKHIGPYVSKTAYTASTDVQYTLAQTAPDGSATSGILRYDVSGESWGTNYANNGMDAGQTPGVPQATITAGKFWPPTDYMNIWIVHEVENDVTTLGFASFPQSNPGSTDGLTMLASAFGYDPENDDGFLLDPGTNLNGTANHEVGHYLNLFHTFEGDNGGGQCPTESNCSTENDRICDIDPHRRTSGCPADNPTGNPCTGGANTYIHNFMNYADDACFHGFSANQKTRMEATLAGPRSSFCTAQGGNSPAATYPLAVTAPTITNLDPTMGIYNVTLNGITHTSWSSSHDGGYLNRIASAARINLNFNTMYAMSVQVGVGSSNGELVNVYIDYNNNGSFADAGEEIYATSPGAGMSGGGTFNFNFTTPAQTGGSSSRISSPPADQGLRMRIISDFDDGVTPLSPTHVPSQGGQIEDFAVQFNAPLPVHFTDFMAIPGQEKVILDWSTKVEVNNDRFEVERKIGIDNNFSYIGSVKGNGSSLVNQNYTFEDTALDSDIIYYYRLKQVDYNGDFMYSETVSAQPLSETTSVKLFPNPANNITRMQFTGNWDDRINVNIYSSNGVLMRSLTINAKSENQVTLDLSELPKGLYLIQSSGQFTSQLNKLLVN